MRYLQGSSILSCTFQKERLHQPDSTSLVGMADTRSQTPAHYAHSRSLLDTCAGWGTWCQLGSNGQQSRRVEVSVFHQCLCMRVRVSGGQNTL